MSQYTNLSVLSNQATPFEQIKQIEGIQEYWYGRDLMALLGYVTWQKFSKVAQSVIEEIQYETGDFTQAGKFFQETTNTKPRENVKLTRLACYKIAMRGDTDECKQARTYFATQTRKQEIQENKPTVIFQTGHLEFLQGMLDHMKNQQAELNQVKQTQEYHAQQIKELENRPAAIIPTGRAYEAIQKAKKRELRSEIADLIHQKFQLFEPSKRYNEAKKEFAGSHYDFPADINHASIDTLKDFLNFLKRF